MPWLLGTAAFKFTSVALIAAAAAVGGFYLHVCHPAAENPLQAVDGSK